VWASATAKTRVEPGCEAAQHFNNSTMIKIRFSHFKCCAFTTLYRQAFIRSSSPPANSTLFCLRRSPAPSCCVCFINPNKPYDFYRFQLKITIVIGDCFDVSCIKYTIKELLSSLCRQMNTPFHLEIGRSIPLRQTFRCHKRLR